MLAVTVAAACGPTPAPTAPAPPLPIVAARLADVSPVVMVAAGDTVFHADLEGVWAVPATGGRPRRVAEPRQMISRLLAHGDQLYLGVASELLAVAAAGGEPRSLHRGPWWTFTVDDDGLWLLDGDGLHLVPAAGGPRRTVATDLGHGDSLLASDADALYLTTAAADDAAAGAEVGHGDATPAAIWRVAKRDGARARLAGRQHDVAGLLRRGDRLYWTSADAGLRSVAVTGGAIRTHLGGGGVALAADEHGVIVQTATGLFVEVRGGEARVADGAHDRVPERAPGPVLAGGALVALVTDPAAGASALWRLPRPWTSPITVAGWVTDHLFGLAVVGDDVVALDRPRDDERPGRLLRIDRRGRRRVLATGHGLEQLVVAGDRVVYRGGDGLWRLDPGAAPARVASLTDDDWVLGLTAGADTLYWSDTGVVKAVPLAGGEVRIVHDPDYRTGGSGRPEAALVVADGVVYVTQLGWGAGPLWKLGADGRAEIAFEPVDGAFERPLARVGDALFVVVEAAIWRVPLDGGPAAPVRQLGDAYPSALAAAGRHLVAVTSVDDRPQVVRIDPAGGAATPLLTVPDEAALLVAGAPAGDAVLIGLTTADLIVRVPLPR